MKQKIFLFPLLFLLLSLLIFVKPISEDFHQPHKNEIEYLKLDKTTFYTSSKLIVYATGELRLDFYVKNKEKRDALALITINDKVIKLQLTNGKHTVYKLKVHRKDYVTLDVKKELFNKDDSVDVIIKFNSNYQYYENIILILFWLLFFIVAYLESRSITALLLYFSYLFILYSEQIEFGTIDIFTNAMYIVLIVTLGLSIHFIRYKISNKLLSITISFILLLLLLIPHIMADIYCVSTSSMVNNQIIDAMMQSNIDESVAYIEDFMNVDILLSSFLFLIFLLYLLKKSENEVYKFNKKDLVVLSLLLIVLFTNYKQMRLYGLFSNELIKLNNEKIRYEKVFEERTTNTNNLKAFKKEKGETYIVVIGESQNRHHMSLYGYFRNTTPLLDKNKDIIVYSNAYSTQVYTTAVLSKALTESNNLNKIDYYNAYSIIDIVKKAGFETYWLTNQVLTGGWDNVISVIANQSDVVVGLNKGVGKTVHTVEYDEAILPYLKNILKEKTDKNRIIFVHLMGNHNSYKDRYPNIFNKYDSYLKESDFGTVMQQENITDLINSYDNSILYNDDLLSKIIDMFKQSNSLGTLVYFSDHSEDVNRKLAHNPNKFTFEMCDIPMITYSTNQYKNRYLDKYQNLVNNKDKIFNNAFIYDTLIGVMNIKTDKYERVHDISNHLYQLDENESFTLDGQKLYTEESNQDYFKRKNLQKFLKNKHLLSMGNMQSIAQFYEANFLGIKDFKIRLKNINQELYLMSGKKRLTTFKSFLNFIKEKKLDVKLYVFIEDEKNIEYMMNQIKLLYKNVNFMLTYPQVKSMQKNKELFKSVFLEIDNAFIQNKITLLDAKSLKKLSTVYFNLCKGYKINKIAFNEQNTIFIEEYLKSMNFSKIYIKSEQDICNKNFFIKKVNISNVKEINEINYCTIYENE